MCKKKIRLETNEKFVEASFGTCMSRKKIFWTNKLKL